MLSHKREISSNRSEADNWLIKRSATGSVMVYSMASDSVLKVGS